MLGAFGMFGQLCLELAGAVALLGAVLAEWLVADRAGVVLDEELDVAALAIAAPPPTSAPVTRSVVTRDFSLRIGCSPPF
jgi:hypothetical protein